MKNNGNFAGSTGLTAEAAMENLRKIEKEFEEAVTVRTPETAWLICLIRDTLEYMLTACRRAGDGSRPSGDAGFLAACRDLSAEDIDCRYEGILMTPRAACFLDLARNEATSAKRCLEQATEEGTDMTFLRLADMFGGYGIKGTAGMIRDVLDAHLAYISAVADFTDPGAGTDDLPAACFEALEEVSAISYLVRVLKRIAACAGRETGA